MNLDTKEMYDGASAGDLKKMRQAIERGERVIPISRQEFEIRGTEAEITKAEESLRRIRELRDAENYNRAAVSGVNRQLRRRMRKQRA